MVQYKPINHPSNLEAMQTAMEKHISDLKEVVKILKSVNTATSTIVAVEDCIKNAEHYLPTERQNIVDACKSTFENTYIRKENGKDFLNAPDGEEYFDNTFKKQQ